MLRITKQSRPNGRPTFVLEGRLVGPWVGELRRTVAETDGATSIESGPSKGPAPPATVRGEQSSPAPYAIDLAGVTFADADGVAALRALRRGGANLTAASGFLAALIGGDDGADRTVG